MIFLCRMWYIYHTLAHNNSLKSRGNHNFLDNMWWWLIFRLFLGGWPTRQDYKDSSRKATSTDYFVCPSVKQKTLRFELNLRLGLAYISKIVPLYFHQLTRYSIININNKIFQVFRGKNWDTAAATVQPAHSGTGPRTLQASGTAV